MTIFVYISQYWTGTTFQLRLLKGVSLSPNDTNLFLMILPHLILHCNLVRVQYREYEYGLLSGNFNLIK